MNRFPLLPLEEEGRLRTGKFHTAHKLTLMAHSPS
jgi:uncharacterized protein YbgA (DUF1722 family)